MEVCFWNWGGVGVGGKVSWCVLWGMFTNLFVNHFISKF
ncbi:hypothetical protein TaPaz_10 [Acinetobacter phage TaPaz]|nr:hypothetical protein TaPaz_10 [Acinetobacter phage TaPaz]